ncbi:YibE/F family protein [Cellulomonas hominis]
MSALPRPRRATLVLAAVLVPLGLAAVIGMLATWPGEPLPTTGQIVATDTEYPTARVTSTSEETCEATVEDRRADGTVPDSVPCLRVHATVTSGSQAGRDIEVWATAALTADDLPAGTRIVVERYPGTSGDDEVWAWHDFERTIPLARSHARTGVRVLTIVVAGMRGLRALIGLVLACAVIGAYVLPGLLAGENALVVALCGSTVIMILVVYLTHGLSRRPSTALLGTLVGLALAAGLGVLGASAAHLSGVTSEDSYRLAGLLGDQGATAMRGLFLCSPGPTAGPGVRPPAAAARGTR